MAKKDFAKMEAGRTGGASTSAARSALRSRITSGRPTSLPVDDVALNPLNPRYPDDPEVQGLADSYNTSGQLQAAVVIPRTNYLAAYPDQTDALESGGWVVIIGNRRLLAARLAGRPAIDVRVNDDLATAQDIDDVVLIENIQREALPPLLEAEKLRARLERPGASARSVGEAIGKTHTYVLQRVSLLKLIPELQAAMAREEIGVRLGRQLATLASGEQRRVAEMGPPYRLPSADDQVGNQVSSSSVENEPVDVHGSGTARPATGPLDAGPAGNLVPSGQGTEDRSRSKEPPAKRSSGPATGSEETKGTRAVERLLRQAREAAAEATDDEPRLLEVLEHIEKAIALL